MKVLFLAAGRGERMAPYSTIMEKCLLPVGGKPIIRIVIDKILASKICKEDDITISVLTKNLAMFEHEFRDTCIQVRGIRESAATGNHYLDVATTDYMALDDDLMIHYADNIADIDYAKMWTEFDSARRSGIPYMIGATKLIKHDYSAIKFDSKINQQLQCMQDGISKRDFFNMATVFIEKPYISDPSWMGILMARHFDLVNEIHEFMGLNDKTVVDFGFDILPSMAKQRKLAIYLHDGEWWDVGNIMAYNKLIKKTELGEFKIY